MTQFIKEHLSWLLFLLFLAVVLNAIVLLDEGFAGVSILYINLLYVGFVFVFCFIRHQLDKQLLRNVEQAELPPVKAQIALHYKQQLDENVEDYRRLKWQTEEMHDELLAWVHEMKSPLTAMKLMLEDLPNNPQKLKLEQEWLRLYMLLDQQLHITRLQTIEQDSRLEKVGLQRVVYQEIKALQSWCMEKGIGFHIEDIDVEVVTDAKWLAFIVRQYLSNAVKYSPVQSEVEVSIGKTEQGHMLLKVRDQGPGIAAHDLPRVFKKSYTGTKGRESSAASGMGLYLAKQAADSLGLKLYLQSNREVESGTTAVIQFPLENEYTKQFGM